MSVEKKNEPTGLDKNYLEQIEALKIQMESMVPGEEYNKVLAEHKKLTEDYINKRTPQEKPIVEVRKAADIIKDLRKENNKKVDHVKLSLEYRDAFIREQGKDPWVGGSITENDAKQVAEHYKGLLEAYGDDPAEFTYRFDQTLQDDPQVVNALRAKRATN